ncbi:MAG: hypothetical protein JW715_07330 [Sedimentisphaerales bacterium]|nr:hypothetical protein [Sedimentisphaerales bacterium]
MKKKDIWISLAVIAASIAVIYYCLQRRGYIEVDTGAAGAALCLRNGFFGETIISSNAGPTEVRAIMHRPQQLDLWMKQEDQTWQISSNGPWADLSKIKVKNNGITTLKVGPPFIIKPLIENRGYRLDIDFAVVGRSGEYYRKYAVKDGSRAFPNAQLKIIDEVGNVIESGKFQYG